MRIRARRYEHEADFERVGLFLVRTYLTEGDAINWLRPRWEYMHFHPFIARVDLSAIGVWEAEGTIVAVVHPEHVMGHVYLELDPGFAHLKPEMLAFAEEHLSAASGEQKELRVYINDRDVELQRLAAIAGYAKDGGAEEMSQLAIPRRFPSVALRDDFRLQSLADENDLRRLHRVLWRGFDHGPEPPDEGLEERRFMQSAPNYDRDLNVVVVSPGGDYISYCGMAYEPENRIAYVEPVATDPDYRRMGLGRAAVLEGVRRCGRRGATVAYVGSAQPFYRAMGFRRIHGCSRWRRVWR